MDAVKAAFARDSSAGGEPGTKPQVPPLWFCDGEWDEAAIPRRPWIVKGYILRGAVTVLGGAGSAGKSSLLKGWSASLTLNRPYGKFEPKAGEYFRVLSYNVEDGLSEEQMRMSAMLRWFGCTPQSLSGRLRLAGANEVGTLIDRDPDTRRLRTTAAMDVLDEMIEAFKPDVVILDPLVELHTTEENDNTGLRAVIAHFRSMATRHNIGVVIAHHTRKGATIPGDPDAIRGAGSIVGAVRVAMTVCGMNEAEAQALGIPETSRKHYFRVDSAKSNYAALEDAEWFERHPYELDNGEIVAVALPWVPPADVIGDIVMDTIKAAVSRGVGGEPYTFSMTPQAGNRSIKDLCIKQGIVTQAGHKSVVARLKADGFTACQYRRRSSRKPTSGIRTPEHLPASVEWLPNAQE